MNYLSPWNYRDPSLSAMVLRVALLAYAAVNVAALVCSSAMRHLILNPGAVLGLGFEELEGCLKLFSGLELAVFLVTILPWMHWKWVLMCNAHALHPDLERTPRWAAWSYFVPVVTLWAPYMCMRDIIRALHVRDQPAARHVAVAWWTMFTVVRLSDGLIERRLHEEPSWLNALHLEMALGSARLALAAFAFALVSTVTMSQRRRYDELQAASRSGAASP